MLQRIGISLEDKLLEQFDDLIQEKGYGSRSEAIRDLIRRDLVRREWAATDDTESRVAVATLVYDHEASDLAQKLTHIQHQSHESVVSALHVHLDAHHCLEVLILRGTARQLLTIGDALVSTRGVLHGELVPATTGERLA